MVVEAKPGLYPLKAGSKMEIDIRFLRAMSARPENLSVSFYIKRAVAEWYEEREQKQVLESEAEKIKRELEGRITTLEEKLKSGQFVNKPKSKEELDRDKLKETEEGLKGLVNAF